MHSSCQHKIYNYANIKLKLPKVFPLKLYWELKIIYHCENAEKILLECKTAKRIC